MRPALGVDAARGLLLDPVVADRGRGVETVGDVGVGELLDEAGLHGVGGPDAGVAVGLELEAHRAGGLALAVVAHRSSVPSRCWTWWPYSWAIT